MFIFAKCCTSQQMISSQELCRGEYGSEIRGGFPAGVWQVVWGQWPVDPCVLHPLAWSGSSEGCREARYDTCCLLVCPFLKCSCNIWDILPMQDWSWDSPSTRALYTTCPWGRARRRWLRGLWGARLSSATGSSCRWEAFCIYRLSYNLPASNVGNDIPSPKAKGKSTQFGSIKAVIG